MNTNILSWLKSTGLDEQRSRIYLASLSRGETTASDIAKDVKMGRTALYDNLRVLESRGYVSTVRRGKRLVFVPLHPKELFKKIENQRDQLKDLLPDFLAHYAETSQQPFVQLFTGPLAAREVFEDILSATKNEYVYFSPPLETMKTVERAYMVKWVERRIAKKIKSRSLRVASKDIGDPFFGDDPKLLREVRYLHGAIDLKSTIYVYENNVAVISTRKEGAAFILHSPDLAYSLKQLFEFLWGISVRS